MATTLKILSQTTPSSATLTTSYTVPTSTQTVVSSIVVCNRSAVATSFRISVAVDGAADASNQYLYYDIAISGNETFTATLGMTLGADDVIRVYATLATLTFTFFGQENT